MNKLARFHHFQGLLDTNPGTHLHSSFSASLETDTRLLHSQSFKHVDDRSLISVKSRHAQVIKSSEKWSSDPGASALVTSYLEIGDRGSAVVGFLLGLEENYANWSSFLEEFDKFGGELREILEVYRDLQCVGVSFGSRVVTFILKICGFVGHFWLGLEIHGDLIKKGLDTDAYVSLALMGFYNKLSGVGIANQVFDELPEPDDRLWNEVVLLNLQSGEFSQAIDLFRRMQFACSCSEEAANSRTIVKMLQACGKEGALNQGKQIHGYVLKLGLVESNLLICNSLVSMYSRNRKLNLATKAFDSMKDPGLASWNAMITSHALHGHLNDAWNLFHEMEFSGTKPDIITWNCLLSGHALHGSYGKILTILQRMQTEGFRLNSSSVTIVLQAVIELGLAKFGKQIHGYVIRNGLDLDDVYVGTSLLDMYIKNDSLSHAQVMFDNMKNKNVFAWNALISGYSYKGRFDDARRLLARMDKEGAKPDLVTWNGLVSGYSMHGKSREALSVMDDIKRSGLRPNVVTWTALISGFSQQGKYRISLDHFMQMRRERVSPSSATISSLLRTCGGLSLLHKGKEAHCFSIKNRFVEDVYIATALIDMYSKSGDLKSAYAVFKKTKNKTLACWNCMMMGFANFGLGREVISLFDQIGLNPDAISFTAVLSGCKNSGLVAEGWKHFDSMSQNYGLNPTTEHYSCMVDLLGRAGYLDEAWDFIQRMPLKPDVTVWGAFLGSCRIHRNLEYAEIAARQLYELEPHNSANYVLMMSLYAISNRWDDVERTKDRMFIEGLKPGPIWSWIQIEEQVHMFTAGGKPHPDEGEIYFELYQLVSQIKELGYVPDMNCILQKVDEAEKEKLLLGHTEKLAITYGLIKRSRGNMPIRVIKNTRTCSDCHSAAKLISIAKGCEILLRDGVRFHHFKEGKCSCNDYW
ncbi:Pentatricopeptide repeat-containing protein At4g01030, mitochondrial [Linum grandiflorum]